jgi:hypothetical protein
MADQQGAPPPSAAGYPTQQPVAGTTQPQQVYGQPQGYPQQQPQYPPQQYPQPHYSPQQYQQPVAPQQTQPKRDLGAEAARFAREHITTPETKEFFKTSEFGLWVLGVFALLVASSALPDAFDAIRAWTLVTVLSIGYVISRGLAKAGAHRADDVDHFAGNDTMAQIQRHVSTPETKEFFKTSEFAVWALTSVAILIAAAIVDVFDARTAWTLVTYMTAGYMVSRGISKIGTRREVDRMISSGQGAGYAAGSFPAPPVGGIEQTPVTPGLAGQPTHGVVDVRHEVQREDQGYVNR